MYRRCDRNTAYAMLAWAEVSATIGQYPSRCAMLAKVTGGLKARCANHNDVRHLLGRAECQPPLVAAYWLGLSPTERRREYIPTPAERNPHAPADGAVLGV